MVYEVELKVRVKDSENLKNKLNKIAIFVRKYTKQDIYYISEVLEKTVRIRKDIDWIVTYKEKQIKEGVEVNNEQEFTVSDFSAFLSMLYGFGFREDIRKNKEGYQYKSDDILFELSNIQGLGWYLEIEKLVEKENQADAARTEILGLLKKLGFCKDDLETRYYTEMLREKKND